MRLALHVAFAVLLISTVTPAFAGVTVFDDLGRTITLPAYPKRVISIAPSVTEFIYAVGAGNLLVGDTVYCDYPPQATKVAHIGGAINPSPEKIISLRPDLIIVGSQTLSRPDADMYSKQWRCPVLVTAASTYAQAEHDAILVGDVLDRKEGGAAVAARMESVRTKVESSVAHLSKPNVFVVVWPDPMVTATGKSFIGDVIRLAGGINIAENTPGAYPSYSLEMLASHNPDVLIVDDSSADAISSIKALPGASRLKAVKTNQIYAIHSDWVDRPGPRLADGLEQIARILHPALLPPSYDGSIDGRKVDENITSILGRAQSEKIPDTQPLAGASASK